ncbi:hypothetical protein [Edaphobacter sp. 12200R-103]|jgi:hypothetical protein|uniref:hypothetical protein n=1 Tax=Edaphobacter sp. 12200R-103 TaxID=2703788 RepID=UPI00138C1CD6|nr:hypothetical protein [Edaphobacter sp. 12200R-103]QHS50349.1 hypothetical protein GWR55_00220 [Edaphobacter sp. 12200R-103]
MNHILWGGIGVALLIVIVVVTMAKTRWGRLKVHEPAPPHPNRGRVSGHEDD